jgi:alkylated DNA repair dioxygenase AlkB
MLKPQLILEDGSRGARITYHPNYLDQGAADALFNWMLDDTPWQREAPVVFGKAHEVSRRTFAYGTPGLVYRYSGVDRIAVAWPNLLVSIVDRLREDLGTQFNFGLCNLYPDGDASIGKHADAEVDIVRDSPIVGLSLGVTRDFFLYDRADKRLAQVALEHGSLVVMWGTTQRHFKHAVPIRKRVKEPRINITFRVMKTGGL